jgi:hypothetical protein
MGVKIRIKMETWYLLPVVIPGLDPGIARAAGVRGDPRIKSGDDDGKASHDDGKASHDDGKALHAAGSA